MKGIWASGGVALLKTVLPKTRFARARTTRVRVYPMQAKPMHVKPGQAGRRRRRWHRDWHESTEGAVRIGAGGGFRSNARGHAAGQRRAREDDDGAT